MKIYLYVKQHKVTKLKYFGMTTRNPYTYYGSGKYWSRHLKIHGRKVETLNIYEFENLEECSTFAINFSHKNQIVESNEWANLEIEDALKGRPTGRIVSEEEKKVMSEKHWTRKIERKEDNPNYGSKRTREQKYNISKSLTGRKAKKGYKFTEKHKQSLSITRKNKNNNLSSQMLNDKIVLFNEIIGIYKSKPDLRIKHDYITKNGKYLSYERAFAKEYCSMFGMTDVSVYNIITKKHTLQRNYVSNSEWEILTPSGFQNFDGIVKNVRSTLEIKFSDDSNIIVTKDHVFVDQNIEYKACELYENQIIFGKVIIEIKSGKTIEVYDPINVDNGNLYIGNDIVHHNCSFIGSSLTLISGDTLSRLSFVEYIYQKNDVDFIEYPEKDHVYFIPVDTSEGIGGDYSAFSVIDITQFPYRVVAKFRSNKVNYLFYPNIIHQIAKMYFDAFVLVEINSIGNQVAHILYDDLEYENLMMVSQETKKGQYLSLENKANFGVKTTKQVKRIGCQTLKTLIEDNKLLVTDKDIINEFSTFIETKGTYAADSTYHDDLVMGLVLFAWATQDNMFKDIINTDTRKAIIERREKEMEDFILPVGYLNDGTEDEEEILSFF